MVVNHPGNVSRQNVCPVLCTSKVYASEADELERRALCGCLIFLFESLPLSSRRWPLGDTRDA
jgi:hypothetical protein